MENSLDAKISIIVPVLNAEKYIRQCLDALGQLDYPKDSYEVIVVDNGSTDATLEIAREYNVKILSKPKCTISALRNFGAAQATGETLAFLDADCVAPKDWLKNALAVLKDPKNGAAGCWYALPRDPSFIEQVWDIHMRSRREKKGGTDWVPSGNLLMARQIFRACGGFNEALITAEDVDICERIRKEKTLVFSDPALAVEHLGNPKTIKDFFRKEYWRGKGVAQTVLKGDLRPEFMKAVLMAIVFLLLMAGTVAGAVVLAAAGSGLLLAVSVVSMTGIVAALSARAVAGERQGAYFLPMSFLFLLFGVSRACALLDAEVFLRAIRKGSVSR